MANNILLIDDLFLSTNYIINNIFLSRQFVVSLHAWMTTLHKVIYSGHRRNKQKIAQISNATDARRQGSDTV